MDFKNKVVIVTGASSGIGAASAILFAKYGAKLCLVGRNESRLRNVANQCQTANGVQPLRININLTAKGACETVISGTVAIYNRIDVLVNCAAKFVLESLFDDKTDVFDELIDINLRVPYKLTHLALPYLIKSKGNIVNLNTPKYHRVRHGFLPFSVAKAALKKFSKGAAIELAAAGVRVNSIHPGVTRTNILRNLGMEEDEMDYAYEELESEINIMEADEVENMVVFIASNICPSMNGVHIKIDGAQSLDFL